MKILHYVFPHVFPLKGQKVDVDFLLPRNSVIADRVGSSLEVGATTILSEGVTIDER